MRAFFLTVVAVALISPVSLRAQQQQSGSNRWEALYAPLPKYPLDARRRRATGTGLYALHILPNGTVASVEVITSARAGILDDAAIAAFRQWRFKPTGSSRVLRIPFTFALSAR
jgi:protein TonB